MGRLFEILLLTPLCWVKPLRMTSNSINPGQGPKVSPHRPAIAKGYSDAFWLYQGVVRLRVLVILEYSSLATQQRSPAQARFSLAVFEQSLICVLEHSYTIVISFYKMTRFIYIHPNNKAGQFVCFNTLICICKDV